jgi:transposase
MTQTAAAKLFGVSLRAVNQWMAATKQGGLRALHAKPRGRPAGASALTPAQAMKVRQRIVDAMPDQLKLPFYLWTRAAVAALIARDCDVTVSLTTVGRYLAAWGFSVQKPVRRAYERNDVAITKWLKREYPAIARDAKHRAPRSTGAMKWDCAVTTSRAPATRRSARRRSYVRRASDLVAV